MKRKNKKSSPNSLISPPASKKQHTPEVLPAESEGEEDTDAVIEAEFESAESTPIESTSQDIEETEFTTSVAASDPLRRYMDEVRRYPLLSPEEEFRLAMQLRDQGDVNAARALVSANLRLVIKIAYEYRSFYTNLLDLIQEGNVGLMKAVSKFDPTKGARLGYYASWWIRSYILKYLLDNFRLVKIGTTQAQKKLFYHLMREKERLEAQGLLAGPKLLAEKLQVREKDVIEMEQRLGGGSSDLSLDAHANREEGSGPSHLDTLADEHEGADDVLARDQWIRLIRDKLPEFQKNLSPKELQILRERLLADEPKTLQEVADVYGLTRERARQIEAKLLSKLREFLKSDLL